MTYEAWRITFQSPEHAAQSAYNQVIEKHARIKELEAKLAALAKQEPAAYRKRLEFEDGSEEWKFCAFPVLHNAEPLYARPVPAEPVNARLVEALKRLERAAFSREISMGDPSSLLAAKAELADAAIHARAAIAAAEAQQAGPNTDPADMVNRAFQDGINSGYAQAMMDEMARHRQAEPEIVEGATCRNALRRDGKPFPKSSCQRCGTLLRPGWKCADGVEV